MVPSVKDDQFQMRLDTFAEFEVEIPPELVFGITRDEVQEAEFGVFSSSPMILPC